MKTIILIFFLLVGSCSGTPNKESAPESDSINFELILDTVPGEAPAEDPAQYMAKSLGESIPVTFLPETISVQKDTIIKKPVEKRSMDITKLDTTSYIPELKANVEKINYQQKQLDSLLKKKK
jgi:hypothetical protein